MNPRSAIARLFQNILVISIFIFFVHVSTRMFYYFYLYYQPLFQGEMMRGALNIARDGRLANVFRPDSGASAHVAPLYPYLLAGIYRLVGPDLMNRRVAQDMLAILSSSLFAAALPWLARRAKLHPGAGIVAGLLLALIPMNYWIELSGQWEAPVIPLTLAPLLAAFCAMDDRDWSSWRSAAVTGLILGVVSLLTPVALMVAAVALAGKFWAEPMLRPRIASRGLVLLMAACVPNAPWACRNYLVFREFVPIRSNLGLELMLGNNDYADGVTSYFVECNFHPMVNRGELDEYRRVGEVAYMHSKAETAKAWIASHPGRFAHLIALRAYRFWLPPVGIWPAERLFPRWFRMTFESGVSLASFCALGWLFLERHPHRWALLAILIAPSLIYLVTHVNERYSYMTRCYDVFVTCALAVELVPRATTGRGRCSLRPVGGPAG